jgi:Ca-activated chloride channel homolog
MMMKRILTILLALTVSASLWAQVDRSEVRAGNRKFRKADYKNAEIDYRKALVKDSLSVAGCYNLASTLYRMEDWDGAQKALEPVKETISGNLDEASYWYNAGDVALQKKDYAAAVDAFKQSLLKAPDDLDAKENYIYAKLMLQNQQNGGGGNDQNQNQDQNDQNQDQNQNQNQDQNQDQQNQNNDQNQDQNQQNQPQQGSGEQPKISPQQAQQMLQAIQAKEKETQDKVNKEKAEVLKSRQKEKNW